MQSILVKDYMDPYPHAISHTMNVRQVVRYLLQKHISGAPVVDEHKKVIGFVSEQDCLKEVLNEAFFCDEPVSVLQLMRHEVLSVAPDTDIIELAQTLMQTKPKIYPVIEDGTLVGSISRSLILKALLDNSNHSHTRW